jgi:DNA repair exonuclease SbcCD ATPase subunit
MGKGKKKSGASSAAASEVVAVDNADKAVTVETAPPPDSGRSETPVEENVEMNGEASKSGETDSGVASENTVKDTPTVPEPRAHDDQQSEQQIPEPTSELVQEVTANDQYVEISTAKTWDDPTPLSQSGLIPADGHDTNGATTDVPGDVPATSRVDEDDEEDEDDEDDATHISRLEQELESTRAEKEQLGTKYSNLLSKLTMMRQSLGDRLRDDAEELDRREAQINQLTGDLAAAKESIGTLQEELQSSAEECGQLSSQVTQLRLSASTQTSDVLSLTRELRELRGEMEMLRVDREEWEHEAGKERERREEIEEEMRSADRQRREDEARRRSAEEALERERVRANNLQEVLQEFQSGMSAVWPPPTWCMC